jgi:hypothetical protein
MTRLAYLRDVLGFDLASHVLFTRQYRIGCSQCEALSINGVPTHETGCPHATKECKGCNARIPANRCMPYCVDCWN